MGAVEKSVLPMQKSVINGIITLLLIVSSTIANGKEREEWIKLENVDAPTLMLELKEVSIIGPDREFLINSFAMTNAKKFNQLDLAKIRSILPELSDIQLQMVVGENYKDPDMMLLISLLLGGLGVDRFMLGETGIGVVKLITIGGFGIWWLIDLISVQERTRAYNGRLFDETVQNSKLLLPSE